jgi:hypothetical protein
MGQRRRLRTGLLADVPVDLPAFPPAPAAEFVESLFSVIV